MLLTMGRLGLSDRLDTCLHFFVDILSECRRTTAWTVYERDQMVLDIGRRL